MNCGTPNLRMIDIANLVIKANELVLSTIMETSVIYKSI